MGSRRRVVALATSAVMRATALDERPYLSRLAASRASSNPLPSPASTKEGHLPLETAGAQRTRVARLDAPVPGGGRPVDGADVHRVLMSHIHTIRAARSMPSLRRVATLTSLVPSIVDSSSALQPLRAVTATPAPSTPHDRCADCLLSRWLCSREPLNARARARGSVCSYR